MADTGVMSQLKLPLLLEPAVVGPLILSDCNQVAATALATWPATDPRGDERVLALAGPAGAGKSRLAAAWAERVGAVAAHGAEVALIDPLELEGRPLLIDRAAEAEDESLFHLINLAQSGGGALLLVCRTEPRLWETRLPDLRSRLDAVRVLRIEAPDAHVLAAVLRARLAERHMAFPSEVISYLVRRIERSPEAAAEIAARLDALDRPPTRAAAREALRALGRPALTAWSSCQSTSPGTPGDRCERNCCREADT
ncbi:MAG: chromosomal replication initiator DnaA [Brevundimonas sp.]